MSGATDLVEQAINAARQAGAAQVDAVLVHADSREARVRGDEIDFVKQSQERSLGIRAMVLDGEGLSTAITSTSDLAPDAIEKLARETVELARATAADPHAGLPEGGFAQDLPDLELVDPADRDVSIDARIVEARRAENAARSADPRIVNSEGTQVGSDFAHVVYANSAGFTGEYDSASHSLFSEPLAKDGESMQRDYWLTVSRKLALLEDSAAVGRRAAERALSRARPRFQPARSP